MLFRKKPRPVPDESGTRLAHIDLTEKGLTYFSRMTFQRELERLFLGDAEGEWLTVAEMVRALEGTGMSVAVAILPIDDVVGISRGTKRLVLSGSPAGDDGADDGSGHSSEDAEDPGDDHR